MDQAPASPREPNKLHVFISHIWARDSAYRALVCVLERMFRDCLVDHSIPTAAALELMSTGAEALRQEEQLQHAHLAKCREDIGQASRRLSQVSEQIDQVDLRAELRSIQTMLKVLHDEEDSRQRRVSLLRSISDESSYNLYEHPDVLMRAIRDPKSVARLHPPLALAIYERIRSSDVVFMLVSVTDMYRDWMMFESELATSVNKPIITVRPDETSVPPPELLRYTRLGSASVSEDDLFKQLRRGSTMDAGYRAAMRSNSDGSKRPCRNSSQRPTDIPQPSRQCARRGNVSHA